MAGPIDSNASKDKNVPLPFFDADALPWVAVSVLLLILACAVPALEFVNKHGEHIVRNGSSVLLIGWTGFFQRQVAWFANPPLIAGWLSLTWWRPRKALVCGLIALALSLGTHMPFSIPGIGDELVYQRPLIGYFFWTGSILLLIVGGIVGVVTHHRRPTMSQCRVDPEFSVD